jgi:hypothetical protein
MSERTEVFIDEAPIGEVKEFLFKRSDFIDKEAFGSDAPRYLTGLKDQTLTFEMKDVRLEDLPMPGGGAYDISLGHVYRWSRWRRWLNAALRFAWWPLGPRRLPTSFGLGINEMYVVMAEKQADGIMRVEMSSRKPGS